MQYNTASDSNIGRRKINQDRYAEFGFKDIKTMIIADGNGYGGEIIADCAVKSLKGEILYSLSSVKQVSLKKLQYIGEKAISITAEYINNLKLMYPAFHSGGTTLSLVFVYKSSMVTAYWIGDSPIIAYKNWKIVNLANPPHTLAEMLIAQGESRESIEKQSSLASTLTRCIGFQDAAPSMSVMTFKPPFLIVVASDGINYIPESKLQDIFDQTHLVECLPGKIISTSLENACSDNVTVIATKVKALPKRKIRCKRFRQRKHRIRYV